MGCRRKAKLTDSFELAPMSGSVILETKDGAYAPITAEDVLSV